MNDIKHLNFINFENLCSRVFFNALPKKIRPLLSVSSVKETSEMVFLYGKIYHATQKNQKFILPRSEMGTFTCAKKKTNGFDLQKELNNPDLNKWNFKQSYCPNFEID